MNKKHWGFTEYISFGVMIILFLFASWGIYELFLAIKSAQSAPTPTIESLTVSMDGGGSLFNNCHFTTWGSQGGASGFMAIGSEDGLTPCTIIVPTDTAIIITPSISGVQEDNNIPPGNFIPTSTAAEINYSVLEPHYQHLSQYSPDTTSTDFNSYANSGENQLYADTPCTSQFVDELNCVAWLKRTNQTCSMLPLTPYSANCDESVQDYQDGTIGGNIKSN